MPLRACALHFIGQANAHIVFPLEKTGVKMTPSIFPTFELHTTFCSHFFNASFPTFYLHTNSLFQIFRAIFPTFELHTNSLFPLFGGPIFPLLSSIQNSVPTFFGPYFPLLGNWESPYGFRGGSFFSHFSPYFPTFKPISSQFLDTIIPTSRTIFPDISGFYDGLVWDSPIKNLGFYLRCW